MIQKNRDITSMTTFGVPAKARFYAEFDSVDALRAILSDPTVQGLPYLVLGGGSNLLFTKPYEGLVLHPKAKEISLLDENDAYRFLKVDAGCVWADLVTYTVEQGWSGLENLAWVPGTLGGAVVQNIGAYGAELAERIISVQCYDPESDTVAELSCSDCDYGYRTSIFKHEGHKRWIVLSATLSLPKAFTPNIGYKELAAHFSEQAPETPKEVAEFVTATRKRKLPDPNEIGSVGSFFKNPIVSRIKMRHLLEETPQLVAYPLPGGRAKLAAGWLIDQAGLKGHRSGNCGVYEKQALVLVNYGGATGEEIVKLSRFIIKRVDFLFGVTLEPEAVIV